MARHGYDDFGRELMCDRSGRDLREMRREQDPRDRLDGREHRRIDRQDPDRMDYTRDSRLGSQTTTRDSTSRPVYFYADQMGRDDRFSRGHMDDSRERQRPSIDLQSERGEVSSHYQDYFLPGEDINREVIQFDISRYLGNDALVRPYVHPGGRRGFLITAYRAPTSVMIATLKQDSKRYENEAAQRRRQFGQSGRYGQEVQVTRSPNSSPATSYGSSATYDDRERMGRPDVPQPRYAGYSMNTTMDDYGEEPPTSRGYREQGPRMDARTDTRQDPRQDLRHDPRRDPSQQPGYAGYAMDTTMDDYDEEPPTPRGYREQEARRYARTDTRQDPRQDLRHDPSQDPSQQPATNRPTQMPSVHQAYSQDPAYPSSSQVQPVSSGPYGEATQPRTSGPNNTSPPPTGGGGQPIFPAGYPSEQELKTALNHLESLQCPGRPIPHVEKAQVKSSDVMKIVAAAVGGGAIGAVGVRAYDVAILRAALGGR